MVHSHRETMDPTPPKALEREFLIDNLLVRIHFIIVMIRWTGLAPWVLESPFPGSLTSTFLIQGMQPDTLYALELLEHTGICTVLTLKTPHPLPPTPYTLQPTHAHH